MFRFLASVFIKDHKNYQSARVRQSYGILAGAVGIILNICLFLGKWSAGILSGSIAITADAFNNLSDAGSSVVTLIGFRISGQKPDPEHPYGHGRMEYISSMLVAVAILFMGMELMRSSIDKIRNPQPVDSSLLVIAILVASICVKLYMFCYNRSLGKKISSPAMRAAAMDSFSDSLATILVLAATLIGRYTGLMLDGWFGILVGFFILYTGGCALKESTDLLLGQAPAPEMIEEIEETVLSHSGINGMHDLLVHDYGPGRTMISLHAEVPAEGNVLEVHKKIDHIEQELQEKLHCSVTIHMDPVAGNH